MIEFIIFETTWFKLLQTPNDDYSVKLLISKVV